MRILKLRIHSRAYTCPLFEQIGGDGLFQEEDNLIPQRFNTYLWITYEMKLRPTAKVTIPALYRIAKRFRHAGALGQI